MRAVAFLIVGIAGLASAKPVLADETVRLTLVHEQVLMTDWFDGDEAPLFRPCGNVGFLYVRQEKDSEPSWYLHRLVDGTSSDTGLRYGDEFPDACSADGNWATVIQLGGIGGRIVSLSPDTDASLAFTKGSVLWSGDTDARAFVWLYTIDGEPTEVAFTGNLDGVELFAGQLEPGTLTGLPDWTADGRVISGWPDGDDNRVIIFPVDRFKFDQSISIDSLPAIQDVVESPEASIVHPGKEVASHLMLFQTDNELVLIHEYAFPPYALRYLCVGEDEGEWRCDALSIRPTAADIGGLEMLWLLDSTGRLFWIENRGGEFCAAVAAATSEYGNCTHEGPLSMFEEIWWYELAPDRRHAFVIGREPYDDEKVLAVFELAIVPAE